MVLFLDEFELTADEEEALLQPDPNFLLPFPTAESAISAGRCSPWLLEISFWLISVLDLVLALLAIPFNALLVPSTFLAQPIPFRIRRSLSSIALSYALLSAILLSKKCFWLYNALDGCVLVLTSMTCKLQEFPVLFIYLHTLALPLALALQMAVGRWCGGGGGSSNGTRHRTTAVKALDEAKAARRILKNSGQSIANNHNKMLILARPWPKEEIHTAMSPERHRQINGRPIPSSAASPYWMCSTQQIILIVTCLGMALLFTAFDQEPTKSKLMANCSITLAIRQKTLGFGLLSLILLSQLLQSTLWYFIPVQQPQSCSKKSARRLSLMAYLVLACRDLFLIEAIIWSSVALVTGIILVQHFVLIRPCTKCTRVAIELAFTSLPLLIALMHPILTILFIAPVRYSAQRFCPILARLFPTQEPMTPPLPRPFPTVRILITEH